MDNRYSALIFGHSHIWSLKKALDTGIVDFRNSIVEPKVILCGTQRLPGPLVYSDAKGSTHINSALLAALSDFPPPKDMTERPVWMVSGVQGNYYNIVGMMDAGAPFDFVVPGAEALPINAGVEIIPYRAIESAIRSVACELAPFFIRLRRMGYSGIVQLGAPAPNPSNSQIANQFADDKNFKGKVVSITSPTTRLKLWMTQERILREICEDADVYYQPAPVASRDTNGFLLESLCKDAVHGNVDFAALVLKDLNKFFEDRHQI